MKWRQLLLSIAIISSLATPALVLAETSPTQSPDLGADLPQISNPLNNPKLQVSIPGFSGFRNITCDQPTTSPDDENKRQALYCVVPWLADYINGLYRYGIGIIVILAVIVMMIAGVMWLTAAGNETKIADAKQWLAGGVLGIFIATGSYLFLNVINPVLTQLSPIKVAYIPKEDLGEFEYNESSPGNRDTTDCPSGQNTVQSLATYFTKTKKLNYSQPKRGSCEGDTCYCDCSWFGDHLGRCSNLPELEGEGTSWGLIKNPKKIKITSDVCNNPSILKPGDVFVWNDGTKGHVQIYLGDNKMIECGGGSYGGARLEKFGDVSISDFKERCSGYMIKRGAYYIKR